MSKPIPDTESEPTVVEPWETSPELAAKLKVCDSEIKDHIVYLKGYIKEQSRVNKELHRKNIKLEVAHTLFAGVEDVAGLQKFPSNPARHKLCPVLNLLCC